MSKYSKAVGSIAGGHWGYSVGGGALGGAALGAGIGALAADDTGLGAMIGGGSGLALGAGGGAFAKAAANNIARGHGWSGSGGLKGFYGGFTGRYSNLTPVAAGAPSADMYSRADKVTAMRALQA